MAAEEAEAHGIVIVGGGICGLATALALHRKGIASLVLEKSESLRAEGAALGIQANGWRALEQLGVAAELRKTADLITAYHDVWQLGNKSDRYPVRTELRCLKRKDLVEALAKNIPAGAIRFGCRIAAIHEDSGGHGAVLTTVDGAAIKAKVLIGCEGTNSVVARYLELPEVKTIPRPVLRGFTRYPGGHPFANEFLRLRVGEYFIGRLPVTDDLVHFFVTMPRPLAGGGRGAAATADGLAAARDAVLEDLRGLRCPPEMVEVVRGSDPASLNLVPGFWYRPPWDVALRGFRRGTVTVAGDAMHAMGPFIGQGGSAGLEDAVVLARALARALGGGGGDAGGKGDGAGRRMLAAASREEMAAVAAAIGEYVRERRLRLVRLSLESFVTGALLVRSTSPVTKLACVAVLLLLGSKALKHANFDCGRL